MRGESSLLGTLERRFSLTSWRAPTMASSCTALVISAICVQASVTCLHLGTAVPRKGLCEPAIVAQGPRSPGPGTRAHQERGGSTLPRKARKATDSNSGPETRAHQERGGSTLPRKARKATDSNSGPETRAHQEGGEAQRDRVGEVGDGLVGVVHQHHHHRAPGSSRPRAFQAA